MHAELYNFERAALYPSHSGAGATAWHKQNMKQNTLTQVPRLTDRPWITDVFQFEVVRRTSVWVFDDAAKGVQNEPFVCGLNEIIDGIVETVVDLRWFVLTCLVVMALLWLWLQNPHMRGPRPYHADPAPGRISR